MILVRAWRRRLVGGVGVALVVPTTLLAALAVLTLAGGFAGLGALGQAFSGPSLEAAKGPAAPGAPPRRAISSAVLAALTSPAPPASTASVARGGKSRGSPGGRPRSPTPVTRGGGGAVGPVGGQPQLGAQPPTPTSRPTLTDDLVGAVASATSQLPAPVGAASTGALRSAGAAVDQILPVPAPGPPQLP